MVVKENSKRIIPAKAQIIAQGKLFNPTIISTIQGNAIARLTYIFLPQMVLREHAMAQKYCIAFR